MGINQQSEGITDYKEEVGELYNIETLQEEK